MCTKLCDYIHGKTLNKVLIHVPVTTSRAMEIFRRHSHGLALYTAVLETLNSFHKTIKFISEMYDTAVNFLDVTVHKDNQGHIQTAPYTQPKGLAILSLQLVSPKHQKLSLPYNQAIRLYRRYIQFKRHQPTTIMYLLCTICKT